MVSYNSQKVQINPEQDVIDGALVPIQLKLAKLPWISVAYGRTFTQRRNDADGSERGREVVYPEAYYRNSPVNVMTNDNHAAHSFFRIADPVRYDEDGLATATVHLYVCGNQKKVDAAYPYPITDKLLAEVMKALALSDFRPTESYTEVNNVFNPYTITDTYAVFMKQPYFAFRIVGEMTFHAIC